MSEFAQLSDNIIQWSESGEAVLAGAPGKSGYEELAALHSNINVSIVVFWALCENSIVLLLLFSSLFSELLANNVHTKT